jgi:LPS O-antigen subunit length determinant protein (WzzB/FepE family)
MSDNYLNQVSEDEISIKDIVDFLLESWKAILATGLVGLLGAAGFIAVTPSQYEATAQIQMAQIAPNNNNSNPLGVNVEDPNLLMARLKLPSSYTEDEIKACGLQDLKLPAESLANIVKLSPVKGVNSIVELKIRLESNDQAVSCAQSLFENIRDSQNNIVKPYIEEAKALLTKYQARLSEAQSLVSRVDKSGSALSAAYLANRDEVKFLTDESIRLNTFITSGDVRQAKLVAPIYASDVPVFPKKKISLLVGMLAGLFLGVLFVIARKAWRGYRG